MFINIYFIFVEVLSAFIFKILHRFITFESVFAGSGTSTSLSVGSLLDDNIWHDVIMSRNRRDILFSVDRVVVQGRIKGEFSKLNLNRAVSINSVLYMEFAALKF